MTVRLIQLGLGLVGKAVERQIRAHGDGLAYCGIYTSKQGLFDTAGLSLAQIDAFLQQSVTKPVLTPENALKQAPKPFLLIDATASEETVSLLKQALSQGGAVVLANKKPLAGTQADFDELQKLGGDRLFFEATVGAGLPVIQTVQSLLTTGDEIIQIQGCFSGTLGFIFSELERGTPFSQAVTLAKEKGFTEPDPRDDLSGTDVARKALILARLLGCKLELTDIAQQKLYPETLASLSPGAFMSRLHELDDEYASKVAQAAQSDQVLRYVATVSPTDCRVGLESVPRSSDIGNLHGPDNIVVTQTKRYFDNPLVIKGPGAGAEVTAAGVFADIITAAQLIRTGERA